MPQALLPGGLWSGPATVILDGGRIAAVEPGRAEASVDLGCGTLTAGLIDLHDNGAFGVDFAIPDAAAWHRVRTRLAVHGVTAVLPTLITAPLDTLLATLAAIAPLVADAPGLARVLGIHLEGPFLAPARRGAHQAEWILDPTPARVDALLAAPGVGALLRMVTLAPERPGALAAIRRLVAAGVVVALGHSDASATEAAAAADAGASAVTHVFNAMRALAHRDPGLVGAALTDSRLAPCLIVDGLHVDPLAARLVFAAAGARVIAVTDSIALAGMGPDATCAFGGARATADAQGLGRRDDGTIAGAGIILDEGIRRMIKAGVDPAAALGAATQAPADLMNRPDLGRIGPGARGDLVWWDADWVPRRVWLDGMEIELER